MGKIMTEQLRQELCKVVFNTLDFCGNAIDAARDWMIENDIDFNEQTLHNNVLQCIVKYALNEVETL